MPGKWLSAAKRASPRTFRTPSRRVSGWPILEPWRAWAGAWLNRSSGMLKHSRNGREWRSGQGGHTFGCSGRGDRERTDDDPTRQLDLVGVVAGRFCVGEGSGGGLLKRFGVRLDADENLLSLARAPGLCSHAAEREPCSPDRALFDPQRRSRRHQREGV